MRPNIYQYLALSYFRQVTGLSPDEFRGLDASDEGGIVLSFEYLGSAFVYCCQETGPGCYRESLIHVEHCSQCDDEYHFHPIRCAGDLVTSQHAPV